MIRSSTLRLLSFATVGIGSLAHVGLLLQVWALKSVSGLIFPTIVLSPWLVLTMCIAKAGQSVASLLACVGVGLLFLLLATWAYWDTLYVHPDAQGGLIFVVVPVIGLLVFFVLLFLVIVSVVKPKTKAEDVGHEDT